jgi:hypothetical protein
MSATAADEDVRALCVGYLHCLHQMLVALSDTSAQPTLSTNLDECMGINPSVDEVGE